MDQQPILPPEVAVAVEVQITAEPTLPVILPPLPMEIPQVVTVPVMVAVVVVAEVVVVLEAAQDTIMHMADLQAVQVAPAQGQWVPTAAAPADPVVPIGQVA
jgi:hypothetical protein